MRRLWWVVVLGLLLVSGCRGVWMNAEYSSLLDRTAELSRETADRAERGELSAEQRTAALRLQAQTWNKFQQARDGEEDE